MMRTTLLGMMLSLSALFAHSQTDSLELVELYNLTEGDSWFTPWNLDAPMSTWTGVTLNDSGRVIAISMINNNLKGRLPNLNLPELLELTLSNNILRDTMPPLSHLRKLQFLDLMNNQLDGDLPNFNLPALRSLRLHGNKLSGQLHDFQNMPLLNTLNLSDNNLIGGLPDFSNLPNLRNLVLSNNNLDGPLVDFTNLSNLFTLVLSGNNFIQSVPAFGRLTSLFILDVSHNQLTGFLPTFSRLNLLDELRLNDNNFTGNFPNFGALQNLRVLDVSNNLLDGRVPSLSSNIDLREFSASNNTLNGKIPQFLNLEQLQRLDLSENMFTDTLPDFGHLPNLTELRIDSNLLTHTDFDVTTSPNLEVLELEWNKFTFSDLFDFSGLGLLIFDYAPQRPIELPDTISATIGDNVTIDLIEDQGVGSNTYSWYLNDEFSTATAVNELLLTNINALDTGVYHCIVKNNNFPELSLFSEDVLLLMDCPINEIIISDTICQGDTLFVNGMGYFEAGDYRDTVLVPEPDVCDSVFIISLLVNEVYDTTLLDTICESDQVMFGGQIITESGTYTDTLSSVDGCDSIVTLQLVVWPSFRNLQVITICEGESIFVGEIEHTETGQYDDTLKTIHGCDSLVITDLEVMKAFRSVLDTTLCFGDTLEYRGVLYTESGTYTESYTSANGCDSAYVLNLTIPETDSFFITETICSNDTVFVGDTFYTEAGTYIDSLVTDKGCDSIVFLTLHVVDNFEMDIDMVVCDGDTIFFGDDTITLTGIYFDSLTARGGCDSIIKLRVELVPFVGLSIDTVVCAGDSIRIGNSVYREPGTYRDTTATGFCDTVIVSRIRFTDPITLDGVSVQNAINGDGRITPSISGGARPLMFNWSNGENSISIDSLQAGNYQLTVTDTVLCTVTFEFEIEQTVANFNLHTLDLQLSVYPNPVQKNQAMILDAKSGEAGQTYFIQVYDLLGRQLAQKRFTMLQNQHQFTLSAPDKAGYYFLKVSDLTGRSTVRKFAVQ